MTLRAFSPSEWECCSLTVVLLAVSLIKPHHCPWEQQVFFAYTVHKYIYIYTHTSKWYIYDIHARIFIACLTYFHTCLDCTIFIYVINHLHDNIDGHTWTHNILLVRIHTKYLFLLPLLSTRFAAACALYRQLELLEDAGPALGSRLHARVQWARLLTGAVRIVIGSCCAIGFVTKNDDVFSLIYIFLCMYYVHMRICV